MTETATKNRPSPYDSDFFAWTQDQAKAIAERRVADVDWANVAEEIDSVGRSNKHEIRNRLKQLLLHLLKWQIQPEKRKGGWEASIIEQRDQILDTIDDSPSLRDEPEARLDWAYDRARALAIAETGLAETDFPASCPFTLGDIMERGWLPERKADES